MGERSQVSWTEHHFIFLLYFFFLNFTKSWLVWWEIKRILTLQAALLLRKQLAELNKNPVEGFSAGLIDDEDIFRWEVSVRDLHLTWR